MPFILVARVNGADLGNRVDHMLCGKIRFFSDQAIAFVMDVVSAMQILLISFQFPELSGPFCGGDAIRIPLAVRRRVDAAQNNPTCGEPYKAHSQSRVGDSETRSGRNPCWP